VLERYIINDFVYHNIVSTIFCDLNFYYDMKMLFLDRKIRELYKPIYLKSHRFFDIHSSYSVLRNGFVEDLSNNGVNIKISRLDVFDHKDNWEDTKQQLLQIANELINDYKIFRDEIFKLKQEFDIKGQI